MARRLPGKKFRTEHFHVDGCAVDVDVRISDDGKFFAWPDDSIHFEAPSLAELRVQLQPYLEATRRLEFDPYIDVEYNEADETSRYDNLRDREHRQEVVLEFTAGWLSRRSVNERRRWIIAHVDAATNEIAALSERDRQRSFGDRSSKRLIPFTPHRWRRLNAIAEALAELRRKIAEVLTDTTGAKLEAIAVPKLLAAPEPKKR